MLCKQSRAHCQLHGYVLHAPCHVVLVQSLLGTPQLPHRTYLCLPDPFLAFRVHFKCLFFPHGCPLAPIPAADINPWLLFNALHIVLLKNPSLPIFEVADVSLSVCKFFAVGLVSYFLSLASTYENFLCRQPGVSNCLVKLLTSHCVFFPEQQWCISSPSSVRREACSFIENMTYMIIRVGWLVVRVTVGYSFKIPDLNISKKKV